MSDLDPLDEPLDWVPLVTCRGTGCTKIFMPSFPGTARTVIADIERSGWTWTPGATTLQGVPRCECCSQHKPVVGKASI